MQETRPTLRPGDKVRICRPGHPLDGTVTRIIRAFVNEDSDLDFYAVYHNTETWYADELAHADDLPFTPITATLPNWAVQ